MPSKRDDHMAACVAKGYTTGTLTDRLFQHLRIKGGVGSYAAMQRQLRPLGKVSYTFDPNEVP